jgi:hypothetical protein
MDWSATAIVDGDDDDVEFSATCRRKGTNDQRRLGPPLLDSFYQDDQHILAHHLDDSMDAGVVGIDV